MGCTALWSMVVRSCQNSVNCKRNRGQSGCCRLLQHINASFADVMKARKNGHPKIVILRDEGVDMRDVQAVQ